MSSMSKTVTCLSGVLLLGAMLGPFSSARAAEPKSQNIMMTVGEMCGGCVKKITKRFDDVDEVAKVDCSIEKKSVTLVPRDNVRLSPKGIWEIMEGIGKTPKKMVTPDGTFTSKPKF
ncbi:copper chaperone CopZ [Rhodopirellula rubra]|uniref:Copper chaperone CopZ n=2 Tax=Aporhodopirellula rubra TaxID=980271 RepID=A0A7W5DX22_9BACT|nr:heavy-metal-associated domain-containing protein [Aporhodopirellula rubra]MBB3206114.1 copper chaperone CopZ [Aporhodopirellula rubra]